jgi:hypothetical protein
VRPLRHRRLALHSAAILGLASAAAVHAAGLQPLSAKAVRHWTAVAACETGGGGPPKWDWGSKHRPGEGMLFEGGVGFSAYMWKVWAGELGILERYPHAYDAPPLLQMQVAEFGVDSDHVTWGCKG